MADNRDLASLTGNCAADEATYSGDTAVIQLVKPVFVTGAEGSKTVTPLEAGAGTEATALRVTLPTDGTGVVNLGATDNAVLDDIAAKLATIDADTSALAGAISGTEVQVDIVSSALPTGASTAANQSTIIGHVDGIETVLGTIDADTSAMVTALQILDNIVAGSEAQVDIVSSALPTGAATAANQSTIIGHVDGIETLLGTIDADTGGILTAVQLIDNAISGSEMQVDVVAALPAGTNNIGDVDAIQSGTWTVQPGNTANTTPWLVTPTPATSGGLSTFRSIDIDETEEEVKATAGQLFGWYLTNVATTRRYIKFYNATAASTTVGSTTPLLTIPLDAGQSANVEFTNGISFSTAICVAATTGLADADTGAPGANEVVGNIFYK